MNEMIHMWIIHTDEFESDGISEVWLFYLYLTCVCVHDNFAYLSCTLPHCNFQFNVGLLLSWLRKQYI